jgi:hypothetical protein
VSRRNVGAPENATDETRQREDRPPSTDTAEGVCEAVRAAIEKVWRLRPGPDITCGHCWGRARQDIVKLLEEAVGLDGGVSRRANRPDEDGK